MTTKTPRDGRDAEGRAAPDGTAEGRTSPGRMTGARTAKARFAAVAAVCSKCCRRQGLRPRAVRALLKAAAKRAADGPGGQAGKGGRRKLCVAGSGCLGPCPKRAVAVATGASLAAGRVLLLDPAAGPKALAAALRPVLTPEFGPNADLAAGGPGESPPA